VAKSHAAPLLNRFAPAVQLIEFTAPWTAFSGKYQLLDWPWKSLGKLRHDLAEADFDAAVSVRRDPRDHVLMALSGARNRFGFPRSGSGVLLNQPLAPPASPHRADHWGALASALGFEIKKPNPKARNGRRIVIHMGAGQPTRLWPRERFETLAKDVSDAGWSVELLDDSLVGVEALIERLDSADRFVGNDSGPGHVAALLGVPTFTLFGPQLPESFAPRAPKAEWITGAPCPYKPCFDNCRFSEPRCTLSIATDEVSRRVLAWLAKDSLE